MKLNTLFTSVVLIVALATSLSGCESKTKENRMDLLYNYILSEYQITRLSEAQGLIDLADYQIIKSKYNVEEFQFEDYQKQSIQKFDRSHFEGVSWLKEEAVNSYLENTMLLNEANAFFEIDQPIFNQDSTRVIVQLTYQCGRYCSYNELNLYRLENGSCQLEDKISGLTW